MALFERERRRRDCRYRIFEIDSNGTTALWLRLCHEETL
jgi:hypothetical protein